MPDKFNTQPATKELYEQQKALVIEAIQKCQFENGDQFVFVVDFKDEDNIRVMNAADKRFVRAAGTNLYNSTVRGTS